MAPYSNHLFRWLYLLGSIWNICYNMDLISEPVGSVAPRLTSGDESRVVRISTKHSFTLMCPAQSYPVPAYR